MSISTVILGESGTGKTASIRNLNPKDVLLIQAVKKPLPFKADGWKYWRKGMTEDEWNIYVSDNHENILKVMNKTNKKIIIIDDFQYVMANEFMRRSDERGFDKFTDIGKHAWEIFMEANALPDDVRVYIFCHTQTSDQGEIRLKTIGKMLDEKITPEGLFTIVLRTFVSEGSYFFTTKNNGRDTVKAPIGLFGSDRIENDLNCIDQEIKNYYEIGEQQ